VESGRRAPESSTAGVLTRALHDRSRATQPKGGNCSPSRALLPISQGCRLAAPFAPRCESATDLCRQLDPALQELRPGHATACLRVQAGEILIFTGDAEKAEHEHGESFYPPLLCVLL